MLSSICFMPASLTPQSLPPLVPIMSRYFCDSTVVTCMRAGLYQQKNGLLVFLGSLRSSQSIDVGGDFLVHRLRALQRQRAFILAHLVLGRAVGGLHPEDRARRRPCRCRPSGQSRPGVPGCRESESSSWRHDGLLGRAAVDVREAHLLHRVQVIEVAPELLEAVRRRQGIRMIAQMVLAELAGGVAQIEQELGEARRAGSQIRNGARQLRQDHARAVRMHAGDEGACARRCSSTRRSSA